MTWNLARAHTSRPAGDDLSIHFERPVSERPGAHGNIEFNPGPRITVTIEGKTEFVQPYLDAIAKVYTELKDTYDHGDPNDYLPDWAKTPA